jgi:hypothetical protein
VRTAGTTTPVATTSWGPCRRSPPETESPQVMVWGLSAEVKVRVGFEFKLKLYCLGRVSL